jgi:hypothetical protein
MELRKPQLNLHCDNVIFRENFMSTEFLAVETIEETVVPTPPGVSWAAIAAGAVAAAALSLLLVAFGAGLGLSAVSPWSDSGVSASTFSIGTGIYLCIVAVMSSAIGGYLAARMRVKIAGLHTNEVFFRDTAHGFLAWAFATLIGATALTSATAYLANGALAGLSGLSSQSYRPSTRLRYTLIGCLGRLRRQPTTARPLTRATRQRKAPPQTRAEILRLWKSDFSKGADILSSDRAYIAQVVAARTGISQADAEKRVAQVVAEAKTDADNARRAAAHLSFWLTAALLFGAFSASLAAAEGGALRDGTWNDRVLVPRSL